MLLFARAAPIVLLASTLLAACATEAQDGPQPPVQDSDVVSCSAFGGWARRCSAEASLETCGGKIADACSDLGGALNANALAAAQACMTTASCGSGPAKCLRDALAHAKPTPAHEALADAFCSKCAAAGAGDVCRDVQANEVLAKIALPLSDAIVDEVRERCTTSPGCSATFASCAQGIATKGLAKRLANETAKCVAEGVLAQASEPTPPGAPGGGAEPRCKPRTCRDLGATCGVHDDGCGGSVGCGVCAGGTPCQADANEPNDAQAKAKDLGTFTDSPVTQVTVRSLTMPDGDEDWFTFKVQDKGYLGNPMVTVSASLKSLLVNAYFSCNNANDESACELGAPDNTIGRGCTGLGSVKIHASCGWTIYEDGSVTVRVRKRASDGLCTAYDLAVNVAE
jgi:hypothetical protein